MKAMLADSINPEKSLSAIVRIAPLAHDSRHAGATLLFQFPLAPDLFQFGSRLLRALGAQPENIVQGVAASVAGRDEIRTHACRPHFKS
jgi:hypothetical protein